MSMTSYYRVVQFVPDVVRDERLNIGVIAYSETETLCQFIKNWRRLRYLTGDVRFLKSVASKIEKMTVAELEECANRWRNCVQLSKPAASLLSTGDLLLDAAKRYLVDPEVTEKAYRTSADVRRKAKRELIEAIASHVSRAATKLLKSNEQIEGRYNKHAFDLSVKNGKVVFAANAISFQMPDQTTLIKTRDATAWAIDDVHRATSDLSLAVIVAPPVNDDTLFQEAKKMYEDLRAEVVIDRDLPAWAKRIAELVSKYLDPSLSGKHG